MTELEILNELKKFDTPTITNVVATYPADAELCLGLYDPWEINWYTDQSLRCLYPELGRTVGYAVTCVFGTPNSGFNRLSFMDVLRAVGNSPKPVVLLIKNDFPEKLKNKCPISGGNMSTAMKTSGVAGVISDAPTRDIHEVREMDLQYLVTGVTAGHGEFTVKAVNVPVSVAGMDVAPGEIVHMDENGAVKFPREHLGAVLERCKKIQKIEEVRMEAMRKAKNADDVIKILTGFQEV